MRRISTHIYEKIDKLNKLISKAIRLRNEIESWSENNGADICSNEWYENVRDNCTHITGISIVGMEEYFNNVGE